MICPVCGKAAHDQSPPIWLVLCPPAAQPLRDILQRRRRSVTRCAPYFTSTDARIQHSLETRQPQIARGQPHTAQHIAEPLRHDPRSGQLCHRLLRGPPCSPRQRREQHGFRAIAIRSHSHQAEQGRGAKRIQRHDGPVFRHKAGTGGDAGSRIDHRPPAARPSGQSPELSRSSCSSPASATVARHSQWPCPHSAPRTGSAPTSP